MNGILGGFTLYLLLRNFTFWLQKKMNGKKSLTFLIRPGVGITGLQNYLERWTGTRREFMLPAWRNFGAETRVARYVDQNISEMLAKVQKEMDKV